MTDDQDKVDPREDSETPRGPGGDAQPGREKADPRTPGAQPLEDVEDRPNVGTVTPEDYPEEDREKSRP